MSNYHIPKDLDIKSMLEMLLGDGLEIKPCPPLDSTDLVAVYVNNDAEPVAVGACNVAFAAYAGGALSMLPHGGAEDAAESGDLSEVMVNNTYELMNICSRLLMTDSTPHLKLEKIYQEIGEAPDGTQALLDSPAKRIDIEVQVPRYGSGQMSLLIS